MRGFIRVAQNARLIGLVRLERLASEYEDSPIVDSRWGGFGLLAVAFAF